MNTVILDQKHDLAAFRRAIRDWLKDNCPPAAYIEEMQALKGKDYPRFEKYQRDWMLKLGEVGLATPHWPEEYGGAGLSLKHLAVIADELARAGAPELTAFIVSLNHIPATLGVWGNEAQKKKYMPGVARGVIWCQGFSEPGAGSDLAGLKTRAQLVKSGEGDHYVVNGQKIWSSNSMYADYCILLVRTDPSVRKHSGITYLIMDMKAPGVEVRPIRKSTLRAEFSELFLSDVRIPVEDRIGEENKGWSVALTTLASERGILAFEDGERFRHHVEKFYRAALQEDADWLKDAQLRREFMRVLSRLQAVRRQIRELLVHNQRNPERPTVAPSVIKVAETRMEQGFFDFLTRAKGLAGQFLEPGEGRRGGIHGNPLLDYLDSFGGTIAGGSNEIQLNIISERGLGMPRN